MITFNQKIKDFHEKTKHYTLLDDMYQGRGCWYLGLDLAHQCCFGARIARAVCKPEIHVPNDIEGEGYQYWDFRQGRQAMLNALDTDLDELEVVLWACGASSAAFNGGDWDDPVEDVIEKLVKVERRLQHTSWNEPGVKHLHRDDLYQELIQPMPQPTP